MKNDALQNKGWALPNDVKVSLQVVFRKMQLAALPFARKTMYSSNTRSQKKTHLSPIAALAVSTRYIKLLIPSFPAKSI